MRAETDPGTGIQAGAVALGVVERSDETPRAEGDQERRTPDPEVDAKPTRRQFTAEFRLRILEEPNRGTRPGEIGRLLRREGLYTSHLSAWRKARRSGSLQGLTAKRRGAKPAEHNPLNPKVPQLEAKVARLEKEFATAHTILEVQGNVPRPTRPVNAEVIFPGSAEVRVPTPAVRFGGQPLSDVGSSGQVERLRRRLFAAVRAGGLRA